MDALTARPALDDLYAFISKVRAYPISTEKLVAMARRLGAPKEVISFYDSFTPWLTFYDKDDLISRSEQVEIMRAERSQMPREEENSPEEY